MASEDAGWVNESSAAAEPAPEPETDQAQLAPGSSLPPTPVEPSPSKSIGWGGAAGLAGALAVTLWIVTAVKARSQHNDITEISNDFFRDVSAVQISQLADQAKIEILAYVFWSTAATVLLITVLGVGVIKRK